VQLLFVAEWVVDLGANWAPTCKCNLYLYTCVGSGEIAQEIASSHKKLMASSIFV